jgi:AraC-like DNA-binding protein
LNKTDAVSFYRERDEPRAADIVQCWWEQQISPGASGRAYVQRVLPDGCADVIVSAGGEALVVGPTMGVALPELPVTTHFRGLRLRSQAVALVLDCPGSELRDQSVPLDAVVAGPVARQLADAVWHGILPSRLRQCVVDGRVRHAVTRLRQSDPIDVATVADEVGLSGRHLRRLLIDQTSIGPSSQLRIGRLQRFLRLADAQWPDVTLAGLAAAAGYADQAHLTRDVAQLAGTTPRLLLRERSNRASLADAP